MSADKNVSRRDFLKTTGIAAGTLVGGGLIGGLVGYNINGKGTSTLEHGNGTTNEAAGSPKAKMFFMNERDFKILSNATERIFPKDDLGPGAIDLDVPYFIDHQLAGQYGSNSKEYMQGPFGEGSPTQGYQSRLTRAEIFKQGIAKMETEAQSRFKKSFNDLEGKQMDEILTAFQKGDIQMSGVTSAFFFALLRAATLEGAYSDPLYGGNRNMEGWRMKGFPGHQMAYITMIEDPKFQKIEPNQLGNH
ncbi:gluconate 2-dehydrogenase subunit 3 family protein [Lysinibacillus sphaericus]|uniref:Dehydrogenase n=2 Tax=Lysinibacillus TaxID=400634 RepID=A0A2S0K5Y2_LYSSH|nr:MULTISPECIES: gluconate 2-dehydrogenase subunit 3 family protein [Lysinibacillus]AVK98780.1 dehydrogenase [Lysinibacillus sphaericus]MED4543123.1 gluconate 2-dehydrogenase subunit 3 family protein [Lysinibacillus sphaericus]TKI17916.1 gluconate 2-dehydrogenase subunit 3 family protein [Lysinibacillus sphaericus]TKI44926.1 gluconate 2-dehydrogenase subunit 3 family protein [Lysinibacillus tabacifolii]SUV15213.1 Gluconate 2-dehydrogenase subunit 3 precursor [Lysinibacillus sphaericus]